MVPTLLALFLWRTHTNIAVLLLAAYKIKVGLCDIIRESSLWLLTCRECLSFFTVKETRKYNHTCAVSQRPRENIVYSQLPCKFGIHLPRPC